MTLVNTNVIFILHVFFNHIAICLIEIYDIVMFDFKYLEIDFSHKLNGHTLPSNDFKKHMHDFYELIFFVKGDLNYVLESETKKMMPNDIVLIPAGSFHYGEVNPSSEYERYVLKFPINIIPDCIVNNMDNLLGFSGNYSHLEQLFLELDRIVDKYNQDYAYTLLKNQLMKILIDMQSDRQKKIEVVQYNYVVAQIINYVNENIKKNISLNDICNALHFSRAYISSEFSKVMHTSIMTYIRYKKIIAAHQRIIQGNVKISDVAYEYGFQEYSTFYRNYTKIIGRPPFVKGK